MRHLIARVRGAMLRLAFTRAAAIAAGAAMVAGAVLLALGEFAWESWATDGVAMVLGATGLALVIVALQGRRPDWIE